MDSTEISIEARLQERGLLTEGQKNLIAEVRASFNAYMTEYRSRPRDRSVSLSSMLYAQRTLLTTRKHDVFDILDRLERLPPQESYEVYAFFADMFLNVRLYDDVRGILGKWSAVISVIPREAGQAALAGVRLREDELAAKEMLYASLEDELEEEH